MKRAKRNERGFFTVWVLGISLTFIFVGAIMVDFWHAFTVRRQLGDIADGAAIAGAQKINEATFDAHGVTVLDNNAAYVTACNYLRMNSVDNCDNGGATVTITGAVNCQSKTVAGQVIQGDAAVQVELRESVDFLAVRFLPRDSGNFSSHMDIGGEGESRATQFDPGGGSPCQPA